MFSTTDTIAAIATPPGPGGLGVVRLSGPEAQRIAAALLARTEPLRPRFATFATVRDPRGAAIDTAIVTLFLAPHSYTTEDVVEISVHGSPVILRAVLEATLAHGARLARPGEFTFRAYLHGRLALTQAEAVADLIEAATPRQARLAYDQLDGSLATRIRDIEATLFDLMARLEASLDFPDEGYHFITPAEILQEIEGVRGAIERLLDGAATGRIVREGATVVLAGVPNSGKSTLFNAILGYPRSIVTAIPGTTRDLVSETVEIGGVPVRLTDTAGLRESADLVEQEGIARTEGASGSAELTVRVLDRTFDLSKQLNTWKSVGGNQHVWAVNKNDSDGWSRSDLDGRPLVEVSALRGTGIDRLKTAIADALLGRTESLDEPAVTNVRHIQLLRTAAAALEGLQRTIKDGSPPEEFLLEDLSRARSAFDELSGRRGAEDILERIFQRFCIGK
jgi:tRNA modification GTPase